MSEVFVRWFSFINLLPFSGQELFQFLVADLRCQLNDLLYVLRLLSPGILWLRQFCISSRRVDALQLTIRHLSVRFVPKFLSRSAAGLGRGPQRTHDYWLNTFENRLDSSSSSSTCIPSAVDLSPSAVRIIRAHSFFFLLISFMMHSIAQLIYIDTMHTCVCVCLYTFHKDNIWFLLQYRSNTIPPRLAAHVFRVQPCACHWKLKIEN